MKNIIILTILILFLTAAAHPVHISVTNVDYNEQTKKFQTSIRLFTDDFEKIIFNKTNVNLYLGKENEHKNTKTIIDNYCKENLEIIFDTKNIISKKQILTEYKVNTSENTVTLYYKIKEQIPQKVEINNKLLNDLYGDQKNLLIFTCKNTQEAIKFDISKTKAEFTIK